MGSAGPIGRLAGFFLFSFILLTEAGIWSASVNRLIYREHEREADGLARLEKINFARLGKEFCSSEMTRSSSEVEEIVLKVFQFVTFTFLEVTSFYMLKKVKSK